MVGRAGPRHAQRCVCHALDLAALHFLRPWWLLALIAAVAMALLAARAQRSRSRWEAIIDGPLRDALIERALKKTRSAVAAADRSRAGDRRHRTRGTDVATAAAADRSEDRCARDRTRSVAVDVREGRPAVAPGARPTSGHRHSARRATRGLPASSHMPATRTPSHRSRTTCAPSRICWQRSART